MSKFAACEGRRREDILWRKCPFRELSVLTPRLSWNVFTGGLLLHYILSSDSGNDYLTAQQHIYCKNIFYKLSSTNRNCSVCISTLYMLGAWIHYWIISINCFNESLFLYMEYKFISTSIYINWNPQCHYA